MPFYEFEYLRVDTVRHAGRVVIEAPNRQAVIQIAHARIEDSDDAANLQPAGSKTGSTEVNDVIEMTPLEASRHREQLLVAGLHKFAEIWKFKWDGHVHIDSNGEFSLSVAKEDSQDNRGLGMAATIISQFNPRTGVSPPAHLIPSNCWFMINHFDAERMLKACRIIE